MPGTAAPDPATERLLAELQRLRQRVPLAVAETWRREMLHHYLCWREHRQDAPSRLLGGQTIPEIQAEIALWKHCLERDVDDEAVIERASVELTARYGRTWAEALEEGTSPLLAGVHAPIWHAATGCLIPSAIAHLELFHAETYPEPELGWTYTFGCSASGQKLSWILYHHGMQGIEDGIGDARLRITFNMSWADMLRFAEANGAQVAEGSVHGPVVEHSVGPQRGRADFVGAYVELIEKDGARRAEALSMRGFRGHWFKIRYTCAPLSEDTEHVGLEAINGFIADWVALYG